MNSEVDTRPVKEQSKTLVYSRCHLNISIAHEFQGAIDMDTMKKAIEILYKNDPIFKYNCPDDNEEIEDNKWVINSDEFQKLLDQQPKFIHKATEDLSKELSYIHKNTISVQQYGNKKNLPLRIFAFSGYKENQFCLCLVQDHMIGDGNIMNANFNFIVKIYSNLVLNRPIEKIQQILQKRTCLSEEETYRLRKPKFWRMFINTIYILKCRLKDSGNYTIPLEDLENKLEQYDKRALDDDEYMQQVQLDYTKIFAYARMKCPYVSKNSIFLAFWSKFMDHYARNVTKQQEKSGKLSLIVPFKIFDDKFYDEHSGNYFANLPLTVQPGQKQSYQDIAQNIHKQTQKLKKSQLAIQVQYFIQKALTNKVRQEASLKRQQHYSLLSANWTNFELNTTPEMLHGCKLINTTCGVALSKPEKYYTNILLQYPYLVNYVNQNNTVSHTFLYIKQKEQNKLFIESLKSYHQKILQEIQENQKLVAEGRS